jgi:hypothetical protein
LPTFRAAGAIVATRSQIGVVNQQIFTARRAPLKRASKQEAFAKRLASMALRSRPRVAFDAHGNASITWAEDLATMDSVLGLLALCIPQELTQAFVDEDAKPEEGDPENALSPQEREQAVNKLQTDLLALERIEAALLDRADNVLPRPDMSPLAYLGIEIVEGIVAAEAQAAA